MNRLNFLRSCLATSLVTLAVPSLRAEDTSLKNEVVASLQKGLGFLKSKQLDTGAWGDPAVPGPQPAITALNLMCLLGEPGRDRTTLSPAATKAIAYLLATQKEDGGIYVEKTLATYSTSLALTALSLCPLDEKSRQAALKARRFVVGLQSNFDDKAQPAKDGTFDSPYNGGIGYTSKTAYSDLSNTHFALEALYYSKNLFADSPAAEASETKLDFDAAIKFVSRCQNLKGSNDQPWVSEDEQNKGGFVYRPGESKADPVKLPDGKEALRSYASMSYAGLLSLIYADMKPTDARITSVKTWLAKNYSVTENPGMGAQGLYYYYHTMAKALTISKIDELTLPDGKKVNWRKDLSQALFNAQKSDGSWLNDNARWMEKDPILSTAYSCLTLAHISQGL